MPERVPGEAESAQPLTLPLRIAQLRVTIGFVIGAFSLWLARPTWTTFAIGSTVAVIGEGIRIWAAGHLARGRGVTTSGPYRLTRHPLYVGSTIIGVGFGIASGRALVLVLVLTYLAVTLAAAVDTEEAHLSSHFKDEHQAYKKGRGAGTERRFDAKRVIANHEPPAIVGLLVVVAILALQVWGGWSL